MRVPVSRRSPSGMRGGGDIRDLAKGTHVPRLFWRSARHGQWSRLGFPQPRPWTCRLCWRVGSFVALVQTDGNGLTSNTQSTSQRRTTEHKTSLASPVLGTFAKIVTLWIITWPKSRHAVIASKTTASHAFRRQIASAETWYAKNAANLTNVMSAIGKLVGNAQKFHSARTVDGKPAGHVFLIVP